MNKITNNKLIKQVIGGSNNDYRSSSVDIMPSYYNKREIIDQLNLGPALYDGYNNSNTNTGSSGSSGEGN